MKWGELRSSERMRRMLSAKICDFKVAGKIVGGGGSGRRGSKGKADKVGELEMSHLILQVLLDLLMFCFIRPLFPVVVVGDCRSLVDVG